MKRSHWYQTIPGSVLAAAVVACSACDENGGSARSIRPDSSAVRESGESAFRSPLAFPLQFSTTVPEGLVASVESFPPSNGLTGAIRFADRDAGDLTFLRVVALDSAWDRNDALGLVRAISTDFGIIGSKGIEYREVTPPPGHSWAVAGYRLNGQVDDHAVTGWLSLGERNDAFYYIMTLYPSADSVRIEPKFDRLLSEWRWVDGRQTGASERLSER